MPAELPTPQSPQGNILRQTLLRARLVWRLFRDRRVYWPLKLIPVGGAAYVLFPLDLIVDFAPIVGQADDVGILLGSLWLFQEMCPPEIVREHWDALTGAVAGEYREVEEKELPEGKEEKKKEE